MLAPWADGRRIVYAHVLLCRRQFHRNRCGTINERTRQRTDKSASQDNQAATVAVKFPENAMKKPAPKKAWSLLSAIAIVLAHTVPASASDSPKVKEVSVGLTHAAAVLTDGSLWTWGSNSWNALGAQVKDSTVPNQVGSQFESVVASHRYTIALKQDGTLWGWGMNQNNEIDASLQSIRTPLQIGAGFSRIASNMNHSIALTRDGEVWVWGNTFPGGGQARTQTNPRRVASGFKAVAASIHSLAAIKSDGSLWTWGDVASGELGNGQLQAKVLTPTQIGTEFAEIKAGFDHYLALKTDGTLWAWGANLYGQIGNGSEESVATPTLISANFVKIAAGGYASAAIKKDGTLWTWGERPHQPDVMWTWGGRQHPANSAPDKTLTPKLFAKGFDDVAIFTSVGFGIKTDGSLWGWGFGGLYGELGLGPQKYAATPTPITFKAAPPAQSETQ